MRQGFVFIYARTSGILLGLIINSKLKEAKVLSLFMWEHTTDPQMDQGAVFIYVRTHLALILIYVRTQQSFSSVAMALSLFM